MKVDSFFSAADLEAVRAAVAEAESRTSGEIVPYVVEASDAYTSALWKAAALGAVAGPLLEQLLYRTTDLWGWNMLFWPAISAAAGGAAGWLLALIPTFRRWLAGSESLDQRTRQRAASAFLEQEVFRTRGRTGILLFLSLFERRVVVMGDSGINQKVEPGRWDGLVATVVAGIRAGKPGEALVAAVRECGDLLERHGVAREADDSNELPDELRRGDR
jgi:putative membrane protein